MLPGMPIVWANLADPCRNAGEYGTHGPLMVYSVQSRTGTRPQTSIAMSLHDGTGAKLASQVSPCPLAQHTYGPCGFREGLKMKCHPDDPTKTPFRFGSPVCKSQIPRVRPPDCSFRRTRKKPMTDRSPELLESGSGLAFPAALPWRELQPAYNFGSSPRLSVNGLHFVKMPDFPHDNAC